MDSLYAVAKAAVSEVHCWDAELLFTVTSAVDVKLSAPDIKVLPLETLDLLKWVLNPTSKVSNSTLTPRSFPLTATSRCHPLPGPISPKNYFVWLHIMASTSTQTGANPASGRIVFEHSYAPVGDE
jgi:hypothetical protein